MQGKEQRILNFAYLCYVRVVIIGEQTGELWTHLRANLR
jgi:hypothetical protein